MPASEVLECMVYEQIEPFGGRRGDLQAGIVAATIANIHRDSKAAPLSPSDFLPEWQPKPPKTQTVEDQIKIMQALQIKQNAAIKAQG